MKTPMPASIRDAGNKIMTIRDAKIRYRQSCSEAEGYRKLIALVIDWGFDHSLNNDSYYDALVLTEAMFSHSKSSIKLITGSAADGFISELQLPFVKAIERVRAANGKVQMIIFGNEVTPSVMEIANKYPDTFQAAAVNPSSPIRHFIVCDSKMLRHEELHGDLTDETSAHEIKAEVNFNNPRKAKMLETFFDAMWAAISWAAIKPK